jgi:hypothetical protein
MRRSWLPLCCALALAVLAFSGPSARADACTVQLSVHNHAWVLLHGKRLAQCQSGAYGCKCVSCYNYAGAAYSTCYPLVASIPH